MNARLYINDLSKDMQAELFNIWRIINNDGSITLLSINTDYKHNEKCECFINAFTDKPCIIKNGKIVNEY